MSFDDYKFDLACQYHDNGQIPLAIDTLVELLSEDPNEAIYHSVLASCLLSQKRLVAAEYENSLALNLDASLPYAHLTQSLILVFQAKNEEALEACDEALRLDPGLVDAYLRKASIYSAMSKREEAKRNLDMAAAAEPDNEAINIGFGDYYNRFGKHKEALKYATAALNKNAANDSANVLMGETLLALGNTEEADYHAKFSIMQNPENTDALRLFANIRLRKNWFIGTWWRFNNWVSTLGNMGAALVLITGYLVFNLSSEIAGDLGYAKLSSGLSYGWLAIVLYSWVAIPMYHKAMKAELEKFRFNSDY